MVGILVRFELTLAKLFTAIRVDDEKVLRANWDPEIDSPEVSLNRVTSTRSHLGGPTEWAETLKFSIAGKIPYGRATYGFKAESLCYARLPRPEC